MQVKTPLRLRASPCSGRPRCATLRMVNPAVARPAQNRREDDAPARFRVAAASPAPKRTTRWPRSETMTTRTEKDFLGEKQIPADAYYGVQTLRGKENFNITGIPMSTEPYFVKAFGYVKKAAALANRGPRRARRADRRGDRRRLRPADRRRDARAFRHRLHPGRRRDVDQHERERVIANLALERLGHKKGEYQYVNPNDHVNFGQSTKRHVPDRLPAGADPAPYALHGGAAPAAGCLLRQGEGIRPRPEDGPHAPAGRRADVPRAGVSRLGHDHRRGGAEDRRGPPVPARDQPRRHRHRHDGDRRTGLSRSSRPSTCPRSPGSSSSWRATWSRRRPTPAPTCCSPAC